MAGSRDIKNVHAMNKLQRVSTVSKVAKTDTVYQPSTSTTLGYPFNTPTSENIQGGAKTLFPELLTDEELEARYSRFQLVKVIIDDIAEDSLRNGFIVYPVKKDGTSPSTEEIDAWDAKFQKVYEDFIMRPLLKAVKFCRLYGCSFLYLSYRDNGQPLNTPPRLVDPRYPPQIGQIIPIRKKDVTMELTETLPRDFVSIAINFGANEKVTIHPDRFVHLEHEGIDYNKEGTSVLSPVWNLLTVQVHSDWSIGQAFWRGFTGLLALTSPEGATGSDATTAAAAITDLSTKTRLVLPPGWDAKDVSPTRVSFPVKDAYELIIMQIAAGTRIPSFVLSPGMKEVMGEEYEAFLYTYQESFISPILRSLFKKFQETGQLEVGDFKISWFAKAGNPYESAKTTYLRALSERLNRDNELETVGNLPANLPYQSSASKKTTSKSTTQAMKPSTSSDIVTYKPKTSNAGKYEAVMTAESSDKAPIKVPAESAFRENKSPIKVTEAQNKVSGSARV